VFFAASRHFVARVDDFGYRRGYVCGVSKFGQRLYGETGYVRNEDPTGAGAVRGNGGHGCRGEWTNFVFFRLSSFYSSSFFFFM
jgi:hypothetical protein